MGFTSWGPAAPLGRVAVTAAAGFPLQNAAATILTWTAPNDGQQHRVMVLISSTIGGVAETGGAVGWTVTTPGGGVVTGQQILAGGGAANSSHHGFDGAVIEAGSTVTVLQNSPLSAGGPTTVWAELWAS